MVDFFFRCWNFVFSVGGMFCSYCFFGFGFYLPKVGLLDGFTILSQGIL